MIRTLLTLLALGLSLAAFSNEKLTREQKKQVQELNQLSWNMGQIEMYERNEMLLKRLESRLANGQVIGLELVIAAPTDLYFESQWGHSMMRFVDNVRTSNNDIVLGFVADLNTPKTNYVKGLVGGYPVFPMLKTMGGFTEQYIKNEDRAFERYVIPTTPEMLKGMVSNLRKIWNKQYSKNINSLQKRAEKLKKKLSKKLKKKKNKNLELKEVRESGYVIGYTLEDSSEDTAKLTSVKIKTKKVKELKGYTFLKNNCAGALINFLRETTFGFIGNLNFKGRVPIKLAKYLDKFYLGSFPKAVVPALTELKKKLTDYTQKTYKELNDFEAWNNVDMQ